MPERNHIISIIVEHKPGVLYSVSNLFRCRGFNIDSISVGAAEEVGLARMTIMVRGGDKTIEQVVKQLNKLIDVIKVTRLEPACVVTRELALTLAAGAGMRFAEEPVPAETLRAADEIWLSSSTREVLPVTKLDGAPVGRGVPGALWRRMDALYQDHKARVRAGLA